MKRKILRFIPLLLIVTLLTGCGEKTNDNENKEEVNTSVETSSTITNEDLEEFEENVDKIVDVLEDLDEIKEEIEEKIEEKIEEEKVIEKTTISLYDGTEFEISNEFVYNVKELNPTKLVEPFIFTKYEYQIYPNVPLKYIKDLDYEKTADGYKVYGIDDITFELIDMSTGEVSNYVDEMFAEDVFITKCSSFKADYPYNLDGIDEDFLKGIEETIGKPNYAVATYPIIGISELYYLWVNEDDTILVYSEKYSIDDNSSSHRDTYTTTVRALKEDLRLALGLEIKEPILEEKVMRQTIPGLYSFVDVKDAYGTFGVIDTNYMDNELFNKLKEDLFGELEFPIAGTTYKEYKPDNTTKGTYEPDEYDFVEINKTTKLYFSNKTNEKSTANGLTVDATARKLNNPSHGTPDLLIETMIEKYGQPNLIRGDYFYYLTEDFMIRFQREDSSTAFTNRKDYFYSLIQCNIYYRDSVNIGEFIGNTINHLDELNNTENN